MENEVKASTGKVLPVRFDFHHDTHTGWLTVPFYAIELLDLERAISKESYHNSGMVFLEEDLDAVLFIRAYLKAVGRPGDYKYFEGLCTNIFDGYYSLIRGYPHYDRTSTRPVSRFTCG